VNDSESDLLAKLVSDVNAFMASCDSAGVQIPVIPCEVLMWMMKSTLNEAADFLKANSAIHANAPRQGRSEATYPERGCSGSDSTTKGV